MKYFVLIVFIMSIFPSQTMRVKYARSSKINFALKEKDFSPESYSLYRALISGNKKQVPRKIKNIFKKYGFIHLLTPSGIHLSSILLLFKLLPAVQLLFCFFIWIFLYRFDSYHSMERVLIFRIVSHIIKKSLPKGTFDNIQLSFVITLILSLFIGHFSRNPLSFIYSALFWGTIVIYRKNKLQMLFMLNFSLFFISSYTSQLNSPLSIIINPIITSFISTLFPFLFLNLVLPEILQFNFLINEILESFIMLITYFNKIDPFPMIGFSISLLIISLFFLLWKKPKAFALMLCLSIHDTQIQKPARVSKKIINIGDSSELLFVKKGWFYFISQKCKINEFNIHCKSQESHWGGPVF